MFAFVILVRWNKMNITEHFKSNITIRLEQEEGSDDKDGDKEDSFLNEIIQQTCFVKTH